MPGKLGTAKAIDTRIGVKESMMLVMKSTVNEVCAVGDRINLYPGRHTVDVRLRGIMVDQVFRVNFTVPDGTNSFNSRDFEILEQVSGPKGSSAVQDPTDDDPWL